MGCHSQHFSMISQSRLGQDFGLSGFPLFSTCWRTCSLVKPAGTLAFLSECTLNANCVGHLGRAVLPTWQSPTKRFRSSKCRCRRCKRRRRSIRAPSNVREVKRVLRPFCSSRARKCLESNLDSVKQVSAGLLEGEREKYRSLWPNFATRLPFL